MTPRAQATAAIVAAVAGGQVEAEAQIVDDCRGGVVVTVCGVVYATVTAAGVVAVAATLEDLVKVAVEEDARRDARGAA